MGLSSEPPLRPGPGQQQEELVPFQAQVGSAMLLSQSGRNRLGLDVCLAQDIMMNRSSDWRDQQVPELILEHLITPFSLSHPTPRLYLSLPPTQPQVPSSLHNGFGQLFVFPFYYFVSARTDDGGEDHYLFLFQIGFGFTLTVRMHTSVCGWVGAN